MSNIKAIFYSGNLSDFKMFCDQNEIDVQEWLEDGDDYVSEIRVDLCNLNENQLDALVEYLGSDEFMYYDYVIVWE